MSVLAEGAVSHKEPLVVFSRNVIVFVTFLAFAVPATGEMRVWTNISGTQQVEAEFVTLQDGKVWFHRADGRVVGAPLETLSEADQTYIREEIQRREKKKGTTKNPADRIAYGPGRNIATLANQAIRESSGIASSHRVPGAFWTHNDSGGDARLFLFDAQGRDLGSCQLQGVDAFDWEDIVSFQRDGKNYLLIGDCGNNGLAAMIHILHLVEEPPADMQAGVQVDSIPVAQSFFFSFEGDHRDCEAVAVDTVSDCIYLATKEKETDTLVYELAWSKIKPKTATSAQRIAKLDFPSATAMDISPDGRRMIILTYGDAYEFQRNEGESWQQALTRSARKIVLPERIQGESICYGIDGKTLYLTSEKLPTPLIEVGQK